MRSICGALTRPSSRSTGFRSLSRTSVGITSTSRRSVHSGVWSASIRAMRSRVRSLRARWASKLSMRRAGPERSVVKKRSSGTKPWVVLAARLLRVAAITTSRSDLALEGFPCFRPARTHALWYSLRYPSSGAAGAAGEIALGRRRERDVLDARTPAAGLREERHHVVGFARDAGLDRQPERPGLGDGDRVV